MISPRFFGNEILDSCLAGHRMFDGSGDPPEAVALVQQALADLGFTVDVDGVFGSETGDAVAAFKAGQGITPNDPVVGPETMAALDAEFAHELFDSKADDVAGTRFDLGARIGTRHDTVEGFAPCDFQNGICIESGHVAAYAMPAAVQAAWTAAGGLTGAFGPPTGDPMVLDATRSAQVFTQVAFVFGGPKDFTLPLDAWEASIGGGALIGLPLGPPQSVGAAGATFVQHDRGVVLAAPEAPPQPLPQAVFDLWSAQETAGTSLGPPTAFGFPTATSNTFPFLLGSIALTDAGVASIGGPVSADLQRYFQPGDIDAHLTPRLSGTKATSFIGATAAFASMRADIASASGPSDFVYILSWHCNIDLEMITGDGNSTLRVLLGAAASRGVQVRAMLWAGDPIVGSPLRSVFSIPWALVGQFVLLRTSFKVNAPAVQFINGLLAKGNDAAAILDDRHLFAGSHHQKAIIVGAAGKLIAYVGGIEVNRDRLFTEPGEPGSPLFDISVRLEDAGAFLVLETFINRWTRHPAQLGLPLRGASLPIPLPVGGPLAVQVTHTYGRGFPFPAAVQTASTALANGILSAQTFFYMEDQYFVGSPKMTAAIRTALAKPGLVGIIVIAAEDSVLDTPDVAFRRRSFLQPLAASFPGQLLVFERLGAGSTTGPTAYVHSKLLIVDDEAAFIGSPNSNRRSWFHDSEIDATVVDSTGPGGTAPGTRGFARDLRCELWARHLKVATGALGNLLADIALWRGVIAGTTLGVSVRPYDITATPLRPQVNLGSGPLADPLIRDFVLDRFWDGLVDPT